MDPIARQVSRLVQLSENISRNARLLNAHLIEKRLPQPSFAAAAPPDGIVIAEDDPKRLELDLARRELVSATKELHDLALGPADSLRELCFSVSSAAFICHIESGITCFRHGERSPRVIIEFD